MRQVRIVAEVLEGGEVVESRSIFSAADSASEYDCSVARIAGELVESFSEDGNASYAIVQMLEHMAWRMKKTGGDDMGTILSQIGNASRRWGLEYNFSDAVKVVIDEEKLTAGNGEDADDCSAPDATPDALSPERTPPKGR